jgi:hypothetical protein
MQMHGRLEGSDLKLKPANMGTGEAKISGFDEFTTAGIIFSGPGAFSPEPKLIAIELFRRP